MNCYLLAGGRSRRMGRPKSDLTFAGSTFLDRIADAARNAFDDVVAVQRAGAQPLRNVPTIFEPEHDDEAPIFGIARALEHAQARCFLLAIDYPLIDADVLRDLRARFERTAAELLVPMWRDRAQLLCAGYAPSLANTIAKRIAAKRFDIRGLLDEARAEIIAEAELRARFPGEPLLNVNTPEELQEAERHHERLLASR